jgi:hypothetical protein
MPEGGDGGAYRATSPDEGRWVPHLIALARQQAQKAVRHTSALPSARVTEAPPMPDATSPLRKGGEDSAVAEPLRGKGGTAVRKDAGGVRASLPIQIKVVCSVSPGIGSASEKGGASGGTVATRRPVLAPQGLAAICSLASFPPMLRAPTYKLWEAQLLSSRLRDRESDRARLWGCQRHDT